MKSLIVFCLIFVSGAAHAGGFEVGGGGKSVVCLKRDQKTVKSVELLDLWEARTVTSYPEPKVSGKLSEIVAKNLANLANSYPYDLSGNLGNGDCKAEACIHDMLTGFAQKFLKPNPQVVRVLHGVKLSLTSDSFEAVQPADCEIRQVVNYLPSGVVLVDGDLLKKMDLRNRAALIAHEAYYATLRNFANEKNSVRTRRAIGLSFAGYTFEKGQRAPIKGLVCKAVDSSVGFTQFVIEETPAADSMRAGINVYVSDVFGSKLIAVPSIMSTFRAFEPDVIQVLMTGQCGSYKGDYVSVMPFLSSHVEYDRALKISTSCDQGKLKYFFQDTPQGDGTSRKTEMKCELR